MLARKRHFFRMIKRMIQAIYPHQYDEMRGSFSLLIVRSLRFLHVTLCDACVGWKYVFLIEVVGCNFLQRSASEREVMKV